MADRARQSLVRAQAIVNRIWFWLLGRGIVHEPDDLRPTNPPENPELLDYLASELIAHNYDLQPHLPPDSEFAHLSALLANPTSGTRDDIAHFSHYPVKRLTRGADARRHLAVTETQRKVPQHHPGAVLQLAGQFPRHADLRRQYSSALSWTCSGALRAIRPTKRSATPKSSLKQALYLLNSEQLDRQGIGQPAPQTDAGERTMPRLLDDIYLMFAFALPDGGRKEAVAGISGRQKGRARTGRAGRRLGAAQREGVRVQPLNECNHAGHTRS